RLRIDETVAPHPHAVVRSRQFGHDEAAAIVGDDDLDEVGGKIPGLGDDPDAGFGTLTALDHAGDGALRSRLRLHREETSDDREECDATGKRLHSRSPSWRRVYFADGFPNFA